MFKWRSLKKRGKSIPLYNQQSMGFSVCLKYWDSSWYVSVLFSTNYSVCLRTQSIFLFVFFTHISIIVIISNILARLYHWTYGSLAVMLSVCLICPLRRHHLQRYLIKSCWEFRSTASTCLRDTELLNSSLHFSRS